MKKTVFAILSAILIMSALCMNASAGEPCKAEHAGGYSVAYGVVCAPMPSTGWEVVAPCGCGYYFDSPAPYVDGTAVIVVFDEWEIDAQGTAAPVAVVELNENINECLFF